MAIHFYPKVGGRVDFDTPEEAARFFEITGGGTIEAPKPKAQAAPTVVTPPVVTQDPIEEPAPVAEPVVIPAPKVRAKRKTSNLKQRLEDSVQIVMGDQEMSAQEILAKLIERGWAPDNSKDPLNYVRTTLASNKAIFKSQIRGRYHLDPTNPYATGEHQAPIEGHVNPKPTKTKEKPAKLVVVAQVEPEEEEPVVESSTETVIQEPQIEDTESLIEQLSQEPVEAPEVIEPPVVETPKPPAVVVAPKPVTVVAPKPVVVAAAPKPTPIKTVVKAPEVDGSSDPVADILSEFANELGSLV
jgi:hypothetical protein